MKAAIIALSALVVFPATTSATYYEYETDDGVVSFTDSLRRVPAKYRNSAVRQPSRSIWSYHRTSITTPEAAAVAQRMQARAQQAKEAAPAAGRFEPHCGRGVLLDVGGGVSIPVRSSGDPDEVIYVESSLFDTFIEDSEYYGPTRRVYQGDRLIVHVR